MKNKVFIIIVLALSLLSCETDTESLTDNQCECNKVGEVRTVLYQNGVVLSDTGFEENGYNEFYSNECEDDGLIVDSSTGQFPNQITTIRYIIKCN